MFPDCNQPYSKYCVPPYVLLADVSVIHCKEFGDNEDTRVRKVGELLNMFAHCDFTVVPVCDGDRGDTKVAYYKRRTDRVRDDVLSQNARLSLFEYRNKIANGSLLHEEFLSDQKLSYLKKKARISERLIIADNFPHRLQSWLHDNDANIINNSGGCVKQVAISAFQARCLSRKNLSYW